MKDKNLEQQLTEKLGNRSIAPSDQAWERIARNRQQGKQKQQNKKRLFIYYAAAVLVFLFGGYWFVAHTPDTPQQQVVGTNKTELPTVTDNQAMAVSEQVAEPKQSSLKEAHNENSKQGVIVPVYKQEVAVAQEADRQSQVIEKTPQLNATVLMETKIVDQDKNYDAEVDYLLKNAIKEVAADKQFSKKTDNTALLKEVESEMDEYYRDKAMSIFALKNKKIRFAVKE